ncbi:MAG: hypothetical protein HFE59_04540 [Clostridiales bacterium]|nr:hypothetical protein [Clostridiales bacterium]
MKINKKIFILSLSFCLLPFNSLSIYANKYGDINNDGYVTAYDAACVVENVLKSVEFTDEQKKAAKVTGNSEITFNDASEILKKALDNSHIFPIEAEPPLEEYKIESVKSSGNTKVTLVLNRATDKALDKDAFSIICTGGGKDMTIMGVSTQDNMHYEISTTAYKDNKYNIEVTLPNGIRLDKDFEVKIDCPYISSVETTRKSDTSASLTYISDSPGSFYYLLEKNNDIKLVSEVTVDEIIGNNKKFEMSQGPNEITVDNLEKGSSYILHYVAKDPDDKTTLPESVNISSEVKIEEENDIKIVSVRSYEKYFDIKLNGPTKTALSGSSFKITCPANGVLHTDKAETTDNINYRLHMQPYYIYSDNNNMTLEITLEDGSKIEGKFYADYSAPMVQNKEITRTGEKTADIIVKVNEAGKLYYIIKDEVDDSSISGKDSKEIFDNPDKKSVDIIWGTNKIKIENENITTGKYICFATEDKYGNKLDYYEYEKIPEYDPSTIPEKELAIEKVTIFKDSYFGRVIKVQFNESVADKYIESKDIQLTGPNITGRLMYSTYYGSLLDNEYAFLAESRPNFEFASGEKYNLVITIDYKPIFFDFIAP